MAGTIVAGTLSDGTYSGSVTDTVRGACKAWVNFNGTGTVAIRASYNVSSITDRGTGLYTVNFTTPLSDMYGSAHTGTSYNGTTSTANGVLTGPIRIISTSAINIGTGNTSGPADEDEIYCTVFR